MKQIEMIEALEENSMIGSFQHVTVNESFDITGGFCFQCTKCYGVYINCDNEIVINPGPKPPKQPNPGCPYQCPELTPRNPCKSVNNN